MRVPWARPAFRTVWLGALVAALAFEALKVGFGIYPHFANYNLIYGSLGAVIGFLVFTYLAGAIFFLGADFGGGVAEGLRAASAADRGARASLA